MERANIYLIQVLACRLPVLLTAVSARILVDTHFTHTHEGIQMTYVVVIWPSQRQGHH